MQKDKKIYRQNSAVKVPEITLIFWVMKIVATTLGETAGDALSMSMDLGYLSSSLIFLGIFLSAVFFQIRNNKFSPLTYWITIISTTTLGTTLADFADRSLGIGYDGGSAILLLFLVVSLVLWKKTLGSISVQSVISKKAEYFYWITIMFSQTLGTALGDWTADDMGVGYLGSSFLFGSLLFVLLGIYYMTNFSRTILFWLAFILTRPLGAVIGDFLDKPLSHGGLELSRYSASAFLLSFMVLAIFALPQRPAKATH